MMGGCGVCRGKIKWNPFVIELTIVGLEFE
jgi:hypothetical protein